jgi:hypothetical protein
MRSSRSPCGSSAAAATGKAIAVGADQHYPRHFDLVHQLRLVRPEIEVHSALYATVKAAVEELRRVKK